jgi:hypothetical protein
MPRHQWNISPHFRNYHVQVEYFPVHAQFTQIECSERIEKWRLTADE